MCLSASPWSAELAAFILQSAPVPHGNARAATTRPVAEGVTRRVPVNPAVFSRLMTNRDIPQELSFTKYKRQIKGLMRYV